MKDAPVKPSLLPSKSKSGIKKAKMPAKKAKEQKISAPKTVKNKKSNVNSTEKKPKVSKEEQEAPPKRKRGRPRNDEKFQNKKPAKEPKKPTKAQDNKPGRKRKVNQNAPIKSEKLLDNPPSKKLKTNDVNLNMNGNVKIPPPPFQKPCIQRGMSPTIVTHTVTNNLNNGTPVLCKKNIEFATDKPILKAIAKTVSFQPAAKTEMLNGNSSLSKPFKNIPSKNIKSILKSETLTNQQPKEDPPVAPKEIKVEKVSNLISSCKNPIKLHPQRMASLDALAKMAVICIPDRKPTEHHHSKATTSGVTVCSEPSFTHQKSLTQCHERIQFDLKKESKDSKGNLVHKQINFVKEKQQVFVSHSVEQSKTVSTKPSSDPEKKKKLKSIQKTGSDSATGKDNKINQNAPNHAKSLQKLLNKSEKKIKMPKNKDMEKKSAKTLNKVLKASKNSTKEKALVKGPSKKPKKLEQTKSEVKVKETIRMQKTCTYQSVTTVNSHGATNSSVVPVSHVGLTTNFSKTKKTVVTDEECKNKINYSSGSIVNNSYCVTSDSPCSVGHQADYCKFHAHSSPQIIPFAHVQTCALGHGLNRTSDSSASSSASHCDGKFAVHRYGHQQAVIYSPPSADCGCCCSNPLVQNIHDSCLLRKSIVAYPHPHSHHPHHPSSSFTAEYHPNNTSLDLSKHRYGISSSAQHSRMACCCDHTSQHHHQSCLQYLTATPPKNSSLVSCEQSPLDLSVSSGSSIDQDLAMQQGHCPSPLCCAREVLLLRTSAAHGFPAKKATCCRYNKQVSCETAEHVQPQQQQQPVQCTSKSGQPISLLSKGSLIPPVPSTSGVTNKNLNHRGVMTDGFVPAKREKSVSPKQSVKVPIPKKKQFAHGWSWKGKPRERLIALTNDSTPCPRICYPSVVHEEGDIINEKDCVLLRSGPKDTDLPYVAKVAAFWENPEDGEMMMSLLWYYRPEHTDQGRKPGQMEDEVFASRHKDVNSIACIEDKCYVLTYNEYCRYRAGLTMEEEMFSLASMLVPDIPEGYPRKSRLPSDAVASDIVFVCRHVYDFRQKRILKNPT